MADVFNKETRSQIMSRVRSNGNKSTELKLISVFHDLGIVGWKRHYPVKGHPDFVFFKKKIAIFVDGCFWHGHDCRNTRPANNQEYWEKKRQCNIQHDLDVTALFEARGWTVLRIWECELKKKNHEALLSKHGRQTMYRALCEACVAPLRTRDFAPCAVLRLSPMHPLSKSVFKNSSPVASKYK